jgi:endonuclease/exonuclease/phosphatase family metal-dependent hydrolase
MTLRILSYNILAGGEDRLPFLLRVIKKQQPDVIALLEARNRAHAAMLAHQLGMDLTIGEANNGKDHVVWLSRLPVIRRQNHALPVFAKTLLEIEIVWEGVPLVLFATHLKAGQDQEREQFRVAEIQAALEIFHAKGEQPHVLVGDLNTIHPTDQPDVAAYVTILRNRGETLDPHFPRQVIPLLLEAGYVDCYRTLFPAKPGYTSAPAHPALRIDYIFASPSFAPHLRACDLVTEAEAHIASDHFPIWAEFC